MAHGSKPARRLLEGGHEARLPGRGLLDHLKYAAPERIKAGWLYAQFCVSKTVSLKKAVTFLHVIRESDISCDAMTKLAPKVGGWSSSIAARRASCGRQPASTCPNTASWRRYGGRMCRKAISGEQTPQQAMDGLARDQDAIMARLEKSGVQGKLGPKLNEEKAAEYWYDKAEKDGNLAPQRKLANEKPPEITVDYDELIKSWKAEKPKG